VANVFLNAVVPLGVILSLKYVLPVSQDVELALVLRLLIAVLQQLDFTETQPLHFI
jgi:hypothetical protein